MKYSLLKYLVCPFCKNPLEISVFSSDGEIYEGLLKCKCGGWFPIICGVPRMLDDELKRQLLYEKYRSFFNEHGCLLPEKKDYDQANPEKQKVKTAQRFGYEWKKFSQIHTEYEQQFLDWIKPVTSGFLRNKLILDAGCGKGRHIYFSASYGAEVIGIDLSEAVDIAYENNKNISSVHIVQADIYNLPFREGLFDYIYSIGVLHHLPRPEEGFRSMLKYIKKGGSISAWVYGKEGNLALKLIDPMRKHLLSKLPLNFLEKSSYIATVILYPLVRYVYKPLNDRKIPLVSVLPQNSFFYYLSKLNFNIVHSIIFDQLLAPIAYYYTKHDFEKWFLNAKLKNITISSRNNNSWIGFGTS